MGWCVPPTRKEKGERGASQETWAKLDLEDEELSEQTVPSQCEFFHLCSGAGSSAYFPNGVGVSIRRADR